MLTYVVTPVWAQSTFGSVLGTARDAGGGAILRAAIRLTNTDENTLRETQTDESGAYEFLNVKPGHYKVEAASPGFQTFASPVVTLTARQVLRVDPLLQVGAVEQQVTVEASAGVITTETQTISSTFSETRLLNLPANFRASTSGTSPYNLISALPGVQSDNGNNFSIQGGIPSQSESSIDGISAVDVTGNRPIRNAFPSVEGIAEIRVQGVGNNAEYGQVGDITTISKSGTNQLHGSVFWYHQNRALDARAYGALTKPQKVANDSGASLGGPVVIPHLYKGRNKTFFFVTFEDFRLPKGLTTQDTVPTQAVRTGDFSREPGTVRDPLTGQAFPGNVIPSNRINPVAQAFLKLFPTPNAGGDRVGAANYITNRSNDYFSKQYDIRGDHYITSKQSVFARWSWKNINQNQPQKLLVPDSTGFEENRTLVLSHNYTITPSILNEFRFGFTKSRSGSSNPFNGRDFTRGLNLSNIGPDFPFNGISEVNFSDLYTSLNVDRLDSRSESSNYQFNNNTTIQRGKHAIKFGFDLRRLRAVTPLGFQGADNYGNFNFAGSFSGNPFGDFLLGYPVSTSYGGVTADNDGKTLHYHLYVQDSFRVNSHLTLEYGIRYELHPPLKDASFNIGNFDRSVPVTGRAVYPSDPAAKARLAPGFLAAFNACPGPAINGVPCTPVVTAKEAGIPESLRNYPKNRFLPRFGFAWRPGSGNTTIRGGFGVYNMTLLGANFYSLTGTLQTDVRNFPNIGTDARPIFGWPQTRTAASGITGGSLGTAYFGTANAIDWVDPYSMQWNLSVDRNLGWNTGLRVSYIGMKSLHLVWAPDLNQPQPSTQYFVNRPLTDRPFPNWGTIYSRDTGATAFYNALQAELNHRYSSGLTLNATYTFAKNLADNSGPAPASFAGENGGGRAQNSLDRHADYGNVYATRRHRMIATAVYELPFGRGRAMMHNANRVIDGVLGGWQLSSIFLVQSGPWLTPTFSGGDPAGIGLGILRSASERPDRIANGSVSNPNRNAWLDRNAFVCPGRTVGDDQFNCAIGTTPGRTPAPIGRFGNAGVGILEGPGTVNLSLALGKNFAITERVRLHAEGSFTNVPNHVNLADPILAITNVGFGRITSARSSEFGGSRTGQVGIRLQF